MSGVAFSGGRMSLRHAPSTTQPDTTKEKLQCSCLTAARPSPTRTSSASNSTRVPHQLTKSEGCSATTAAVGARDDQRALRQVRSLFLCCQNIVSIHHVAHLGEMTGLRSLSLHMNFIRRVEGLEGLRQLVELDLSGNEIHSLDADCFRPLPRLARLNLSSNYLAALPDGVFAVLNSLAWLSLAHNRLTHVSGALASIPRAAPLVFVDVCGNDVADLGEITAGLAAHREHLRELRLRTPQALIARSASVPESTATPAATPGGPTGGAVAVAGASVCNPFAAPVIRENPLCLHAYAPTIDAEGAYTTHVERALSAFPKLAVLDGVSFSVDPLQVLRGQQRQQTLAMVVDGDVNENISTAAATAVTFSQPSAPRSARKLSFHESPGGKGTAAQKRLSYRNRNTESGSDTEEGGSEREEDKGRNRSPSTSCHRHRYHCRSRSCSHRHSHRDRSRSQSRKRDSTSNEPPPTLPPTGDSPAVSSPGGLSPSAIGEGEDTHAQGHTNSSSHQRMHAQARDSTAALAPSQPATPGYRLHWRPKRVSRGTNTPMSEPSHNANSSYTSSDNRSNSAHVSSHELTLAEQLARQLQRAHEQLQLRVATEATLRDELEQRAHTITALEAAKVAQRAQWEQRVEALKGELVRRADEVTIMRRKERASLLEQANASDAHWRGVMTRREHEWRAAEKERLAVVEAERDRWQREWEGSQAHGEELAVELSTMRKQHIDERARDTEHARAQVQLLLEEQDARRTLLVDAIETRPLHRAMLALQVARAEEEQASLLEEWTQYRDTWQSYAESLHQHYKGVLRHAEEEAAALQAQIDAVKVELQHRPQHQQQRSPSRRDAATETSAIHCDDGSQSAALLIDTGCDPISAAPAATATVCVASSPSQPPPLSDSLDVATQYWRDVATRRGDDVAKLQAALAASEEAAAVLSRENDRLLASVRACEDQHSTVGTRNETAGTWAAQCEHLTRTLRNLEADLDKKNAALDALEEEAREKIAEKRVRIAAQAERIEALQEAHATATAATAACRDELEKCRASLADAIAARDACAAELEVRSAALVAQQKQQQLTLTERQQHEREVARLVSALTVAREQLVCLHRSHCELSREKDALAGAVAAKDGQLADANRRLAQVQESSRLKQQATLEMLHRLMMSESEGGR